MPMLRLKALFNTGGLFQGSQNGKSDFLLNHDTLQFIKQRFKGA